MDESSQEKNPLFAQENEPGHESHEIFDDMNRLCSLLSKESDGSDWHEVQDTCVKVLSYADVLEKKLLAAESVGETFPPFNNVIRAIVDGEAKGYYYTHNSIDLRRRFEGILFSGIVTYNSNSGLDVSDKKSADALLTSIGQLLESDYSSDYMLAQILLVLDSKRKELSQVALSDSGELSKKIEEIDRFVASSNFEVLVASAIQKRFNIQDLDRETQGGQIGFCEHILRDILTRHGLDSTEIIDVWLSRLDKEGNSFPEIENNIKKIVHLDNERPGSSMLLNRQFGIRNFCRYPTSVLLRQFDEMENINKPYGILLAATHDWNDAFGSWQQQRLWEKMVDQIKDDYAFRIVEARSKQEVARRLVSLDQTYGETQKISFAFVCGHGSRDSISFGDNGVDYRLHIDDLGGKGVKRTKYFFTEHPSIVLASCSTGVERGIAQEISKMFNANVSAPIEATAIEKITPIISDGRIDFDVEYYRSEPDKKSNTVFVDGILRNQLNN